MASRLEVAQCTFYVFDHSVHYMFWTTVYIICFGPQCTLYVLDHSGHYNVLDHSVYYMFWINWHITCKKEKDRHLKWWIKDRWLHNIYMCTRQDTKYAMMVFLRKMLFYFALEHIKICCGGDFVCAQNRVAAASFFSTWIWVLFCFCSLIRAHFFMIDVIGWRLQLGGKLNFIYVV